MRRTIHYPNKSTLTGCFLLWVVLSTIIPVLGFGEAMYEENAAGKTAQARLAVEQAWETYHHAALGGTLASPTVQTELEMNLHISRALLAEAYEAEDKGDMKATHKLIAQIMQITDKVITESQEPKK